MFPNTNTTNTAGQTEKKAKKPGVTFDLVQVTETTDEKTGEVTKMGRMEGALGGYSASPVMAEGRIYFASEEGKVSVVRAGREWAVMQVNDLGEGLFATPALSEGKIFLRTAEAVYCFGALSE